MKIAVVKEILKYLPSSMDESDIIVNANDFTVKSVTLEKKEKSPLIKEQYNPSSTIEVDKIIKEIPYFCTQGDPTLNLPGMEVDHIAIPDRFLAMQNKLVNKITLPEIKEYLELYRQKKSISNCLQTNLNRKLYSVAGKLTDSIIKELLIANKIV